SADNRVLFGGRAEFTPPSSETTRRAGAVLREALAKVFPQLALVHVDYAWGGNVAFTRDLMPHAGVLDGAYYAGGDCGHRNAMATHLRAALSPRLARGPNGHSP